MVTPRFLERVCNPGWDLRSAGNGLVVIGFSEEHIGSVFQKKQSKSHKIYCPVHSKAVRQQRKRIKIHFLVCDAVYFLRNVTTFWTGLLPPSSG